MSERLDRIEAILERMVLEREADRREMAEQREADRREMAEQREADRREMAELRKTVTALVQIVEIHQRNFDEIMTYVRGLQVENRRILERVLGPDLDR